MNYIHDSLGRHRHGKWGDISTQKERYYRMVIRLYAVIHNTMLKVLKILKEQKVIVNVNRKFLKSKK